MGVLMLYLWKTKHLFDEWHKNACLSLGLPKPSSNVKTKVVDESAQWTTCYTTANKTKEGWVAFVDKNVADLVKDGLGCDASLGLNRTLLCPHPDDGAGYTWDESTQSWVEFDDEGGT